MQTFEAIVSVLDKATRPLQGIEKQFKSLTSPLASLNAHLGGLDEGHAFRRLGEASEATERSVSKLRDSLGGLAAPLEVLGGLASIGGLIALNKHAADYGDALYQGSIKTGVAAAQLARWHYAAGLAKVETEAFDKGLERLNKNIAMGAGGKDREMATIFAHMGVSFRDATGHLTNAAKVLPKLADEFKHLQEIGDTATMSALATAAFGKAGEELVPVLIKGGAGLDELGRQFDHFHGAVTNQSVNDAHKMKLGWENLGVAIEGLSDAVGESLSPVLLPVITRMAEWISRNRDLADSIGIAAASLGGLALIMSGPALAAVKGLFAPVTALGGIFAKGFGLAFTAVMEFVEGMQLGFTAFESFSLLLAANPIGVALIALAALAGAAYLIYENWEPISAWWSDWWAKAINVVDRAWAHIKPIIDALKAAFDFIGVHGGPSSDAAASSAGASMPPGGAGFGVDFGHMFNGLFGGREGGGAASPLALPLDRPSLPTLTSAAPPGWSGTAGRVEVGVRFENMPSGAKIDVRSANDRTPTDVNVGYAFAH